MAVRRAGLAGGPEPALVLDLEPQPVERLPLLERDDELAQSLVDLTELLTGRAARSGEGEQAVLDVLGLLGRGEVRLGERQAGSDRGASPRDARLRAQEGQVRRVDQ